MKSLRTILLTVIGLTICAGCHVVMPYDYPLNVVKVKAIDDGNVFSLVNDDSTVVVCIDCQDIPEGPMTTYYIRSCSTTTKKGTIIYVITSFNDTATSPDFKSLFYFDLHRVDNESWQVLRVPRDVGDFVTDYLTNS